MRGAGGCIDDVDGAPAVFGALPISITVGLIGSGTGIFLPARISTAFCASPKFGAFWIGFGDALLWSIIGLGACGAAGVDGAGVGIDGFGGIDGVGVTGTSGFIAGVGG